MDLPKRVNEFLAAASQGEAASFIHPDAQLEVPDDWPDVQSYALKDLQVRRNITFIGWEANRPGVWILSWDQAGLIVYAKEI